MQEFLHFGLLPCLVLDPRRAHLVMLLGVALCTPVPASGQDGPQDRVDLVRVDSVPDLGSLVDATAVAQALDGFVRVSGFIQREPTDGAPASQPTDLYLGYDAEALHAVFVARDAEPRQIRARMASREQIDGDDVVTLLLDTHHDGRRAYAFRANPLGVQWDAIWSEGQDFDASFDTVWESEGRVLEDGYAVRMEIPFKSLRFPPAEAQTWGIAASRLIARGRGEESWWPRVSSRVEGLLTQAGDLEGLGGVSPGRNVQAIPYATFRSFRALDLRLPGGPDHVTDLAELDAGIDGKAILDDRFVLDLAVNPDFSQVESDQPQVTVNQRFEVFFPERRPFFIENADYFRTPIELLFTRRIQDPQLGTRFTGKAGRWGIGALIADDQSPGKLAEVEGNRAWFGAGRVTRDVGEHSSVGAMYVGRELEDTYNRVGGVDTRLRFDDHWIAAAQLAWGATRDGEGDASAAPAYFASVSRSDRRLFYEGDFTSVAPNFEAQAGFLPRTDLRRMRHFGSFFFRPERTLLTWGFETFVERVWSHDGTLLDQVTEPSVEWNFVGNSSFEINYARAIERLRPEDHPAIQGVQTFDVDVWDIEFGTSWLNWLSVDGDYRFGRRINLSPLPGEPPRTGDWRQLEVELGLRPTTRLRLDQTVLWTNLDDPRSGNQIFGDTILRTRLSWQWSREFSIRAIIQYERTTSDPALTTLETRRNLNGDLLITYRVNPWTALFVGLNGNAQNLELVERPDGEREIHRIDALRNDANQLFVKASYLLRP